MKKLINLLLAATIIICVFCSCSESNGFSGSENLLSGHERSTDTANYNYNDGVTEPPAEYNTFSNDVTDFTLKMFRNYNKSTDGDSYVFCPAGSAIELGLIANGASGDTRQEILRTMCKDLELDQVNRCFSYFKSRLEAVANIETNGSISLDGKQNDDKNSSFVKLTANLFANDTSDIRSKFAQTDADYFDSGLFRIMFDDENSLAKVNGLYEDFKTEKPLSSLDKDDTLISVTASDICDFWLNPYAKTDLTKGSFKSAKGEDKLTYMTSSETYMHSENAKAILKYTVKTPLKFMAVLPDEDITIDEYINDFTSLELSELFESVDFSKNAKAVLPEFSIDAKNSADDITSVLSDSGLYSLFTDQAEFDELTRSNDFAFNTMYELSPSFSVSAGGIGGTQTSEENLLSEHTLKAQQTDITVEFNRPFIFLVLDNESNIPIYIGTVQ